MKKVKKERFVELEEVGIDTSSIDNEFLEKLAEITESEIRKAIDEVLGPRVLKYLLMVDVYVDDKLNVVADLAVDSHVPPYISLESVIDRAIKRGLDKAAAYVRSYVKGIRGASEEGKESSRTDT